MNSTKDVLKFLIAAYPNQEISAETVKAYALALIDIEPTALRAAVLKHVTESKWFPTISDLRNAVVSLAMPVDDAAAFDAWAGIKLFKVTDPIAQLAINALGGIDKYRQSLVADEMSWRARFLEAYRNYQSRLVNNAMMLPEVKAVQQQLSGNGIQGAIAALTEGKRISGTATGSREHETEFNQRRHQLLAQAGE